jgi:hypothetical protein
VPGEAPAAPLIPAKDTTMTKRTPRVPGEAPAAPLIPAKDTTMTKRTPRVPGEAPAADAEQPPVADTAATADPAAEQAAVDQQVAVQAAAPVPVEGKRPHPSTVDPTKITAPVLTSQGWICPAPKEAK